MKTPSGKYVIQIRTFFFILSSTISFYFESTYAGLPVAIWHPRKPIDNKTTDRLLSRF